MSCGRSPVSGDFTRGAVVGSDPGTYDLSWDTTTPDGTFAPPGRYRLLAQALVAERSCDAADGLPTGTGLFLGYFIVGAGT